MVPNPARVIDYNRFLYARGNPLKYTDPSGSIVLIAPPTGPLRTCPEYSDSRGCSGFGIGPVRAGRGTRPLATQSQPPQRAQQPPPKVQQPPPGSQKQSPKWFQRQLNSLRDWLNRSFRKSSKSSNNPQGDGESPDSGGQQPGIPDPIEPQPSLVDQIRSGSESPGGLRYDFRDNKFGSRLDHVFSHTADDLDKPDHGIFYDRGDTLIRQIDETWRLGQNPGPGVTRNLRGARIVLTVDMGKPIGYSGGTNGTGEATRLIRLVVVADTNQVVTAYPLVSK